MTKLEIIVDYFLCVHLHVSETSPTSLSVPLSTTRVIDSPFTTRQSIFFANDVTSTMLNLNFLQCT